MDQDFTEKLGRDLRMDTFAMVSGPHRDRTVCSGWERTTSCCPLCQRCKQGFEIKTSDVGESTSRPHRPPLSARAVGVGHHPMFGFANRLRWTLKTDQFSWTRIVEAMRQIITAFPGAGQRFPLCYGSKCIGSSPSSKSTAQARDGQDLSLQTGCTISFLPYGWDLCGVVLKKMGETDLRGLSD